MTTLWQFLNGRRTNDNKATHLSMISPFGKFSLRGADTDTFMDLYCAESPDQVFGLLEATTGFNVLPVLVDVDIKKEVSSASSPTPLYDSKMLLKLVSIYQKTLRHLILDLPEEDLLCVVFQKEPYIMDSERSGKTYLKHGFHLHFPRIFLPKKSQEQELIPRVKIEWKKTVAQNEYNINIENILDRGYCRGTAWLLYRSRKAVNMEPYLISFVVDADGLVHDNWRQHLLYINIQKSDRTRIDLTWDNIDYHLPRILSINPAGRDCYFREVRDDIEPLPSSPTQNQNQIHQQINKFSVPGEHRNENEDKIVDKLLSILDINRSVDRNEWMMVGWCLYNIFNGSHDGLQRWIQFSERSPENFSLDVCHHEWGKMRKGNMTIGTLKFMARQDDLAQYNEIMNEFMLPHLEKSIKLSGSHNDLAKALYEKYEGLFVCAGIREKRWYKFDNHGWNYDEEGISLRCKISDELVKVFEGMAQALVKKCADADEEESIMYNKKLKMCMRNISLLKSSPYKSNIMKECAEVFYKASFMKDLDNNPHLFTFANGVYDVHLHTFRAGRPSDNNSIRAPIKYRDEYTMDHPDVVRVLDFLEKIFPDRSIRDYFINVSCQVFLGGNHSKIFQVWTGDGDNGKSITQSLFEKMLGSYTIKLPTSLIIGKRTQSSAACPELVRAGNGVRFAMLQEPDAKDVINVGILKELSGNDSFFARGLYKEGGEITPMFKLVLICNEPPKLPHNDKATWNRVRVIPFESVFSDNAPEDPDEQLLQKTFPKDPQFGEKVPAMAEAFAWFLLEHFKTHPKIGPEPEKVLLATANYRRRNDIFRQFVEDQVSTDIEGTISVQQCYNVFKEWHREGFPNQPVTSRDDFREFMTKIIGEAVHGYWHNVRVRPLNAPPDELMNQEEA